MSVLALAQSFGRADRPLPLMNGPQPPVALVWAPRIPGHKRIRVTLRPRQVLAGEWFCLPIRTYPWLALTAGDVDLSLLPFDHDAEFSEIEQAIHWRPRSHDIGRHVVRLDIRGPHGPALLAAISLIVVRGVTLQRVCQTGHAADG